MRVGLLLLLLFLPSWVYAADDEEFNSLIELSDEDGLMFAKAICESEQDCRYGEDSYRPFVIFSQSYFYLDSVIYGHFSQTGQMEAYVRLAREGTEPPGDGALFRYQDTTWQYVGMGSPPWKSCGTIIGYLGQDKLLCYWDIETQITNPFLLNELDGNGFEMSVFNFHGNNLQQDKLIRFRNNLFTFCDESAEYLHYGFLEFSRADIDANGYVDLELKLSETQFDPDHCYDRETGISNQPNTPIFHQLTWLFDGETLTPTSETQAFLDNLPKQ
jgi:hypothetical protein